MWCGLFNRIVSCMRADNWNYPRITRYIRKGENVRSLLAPIVGSRRKFRGTFVRYGQKSGYRGTLTTILLTTIEDVTSHKVVTDHLWFTMGKRFKALTLKDGDLVEFDARVTTYYKGYRGDRDDEVHPIELDYRLSFPTNLKKANGTPIPANQLSLSLYG